MQSSQRVFVTAVQRYCAENGIAVETRSEGWLMVMQKGPRRRLAYGYEVGLNSAVTHRIANDKAATAELLERWAHRHCLPLPAGSRGFFPQASWRSVSSRIPR